MLSRLLFIFAGAALTVFAWGCSSLTRPNEITVAGDSTGDAKAKPSPPRAAPPARP